MTAADEVTIEDLADDVVLHPLDDTLDWERLPGRPAIERPATTADAIELVAAGVACSSSRSRWPVCTTAGTSPTGRSRTPRSRRSPCRGRRTGPPTWWRNSSASSAGGPSTARAGASRPEPAEPKRPERKPAVAKSGNRSGEAAAPQGGEARRKPTADSRPDLSSSRRRSCRRRGRAGRGRRTRSRSRRGSGTQHGPGRHVDRSRAAAVGPRGEVVPAGRPVVERADDAHPSGRRADRETEGDALGAGPALADLDHSVAAFRGERSEGVLGTERRHDRITVTIRSRRSARRGYDAAQRSATDRVVLT